MYIKVFKVKKPRKDVAVAPFPYAPTAKKESSSELKYSARYTRVRVYRFLAAVSPLIYIKF